MGARDGFDALPGFMTSFDFLLFPGPGRECLGVPLASLGYDCFTIVASAAAQRVAAGASPVSTTCPKEESMRRSPLKNARSSSGSESMIAHTSLDFFPSGSCRITSRPSSERH